MSIEFACSSCGKTLRVDDTYAGKSARCPACSSVSIVPNGTANANSENPFRESNSGTPPTNPAAANPLDFNPYASPRRLEQAANSQDSFGVSPVVPTAVTMGPIFEYALSAWKENLGILIGAFIIAQIPGWIYHIGVQILAALGSDKDLQVFAVMGMVVLYFTFLAANLWITIGQTMISLRIARGEKVAIGVMFQGGPFFWRYFLATLLAGLCTILGFALLIVPGIILCLMFWPFMYVLIDRKTGVMESFSIGKEIANDNWGTTFLLWLTSIGVCLLGYLVCCVGLVAAMPLISMMFVTGYLMMSGQIPPNATYSTVRLRNSNNLPPIPPA